MTKQIPRRLNMSISNFISNLLQLKDPNIKFSKEFSTIIKKHVTYTLITGTLTYSPDICPICGSIYENHNIIKNGFKPSDIKLLPCNGNPTILRLKKQRFLCKECGHTFSARTNIVDEHCYISRQIKLKILDNLKLKISEKDIAYLNYISHSTVSRAIDNNYQSFQVKSQYLPVNLMFDEFKSTKDAKGSMSFIYADSDTHQILDIVENRQLPFLKNYFSKFTKDSRNNVKTICIDMYSPYISLINEYFPSAQIVIDRFHIVQLLNRALQKTRIEIMKEFSTSSMEYKRLKRYWKLITKNRTELNSIHFSHRTHFKRWVSDMTIVDTSIAVNDILKETYYAYQILLMDISRKDGKLLKKHLNELENANISDSFKSAIKTLLGYSSYILNALDTPYSNGPIEGLNNYIKVIKRIAFGYKSFFHFRNRILITKNLLKPLKMHQA